MMTFPFRPLLLLFSLIVFPGSLTFAQQPTGPVPYSGPTGVIMGKLVMKGGDPLSGGSVSFFDASAGPSPYKEEVKRIPSVKVLYVNDDGTFRVELPPGKYYMKATKRFFSKRREQYVDGDYVFHGMDDKGAPKEYIVKAGQILDIGIVSVSPYKRPKPDIKTAISGVISDSEGKPVQGIKIYAFRNNTKTERPVFFSWITGPDGKYFMGVSEGTYFLRARTRMLGGRPAPGEYVGMFGGQTPVPVEVKDGEIKKGIDITVIKVPERGPGSELSPMGPR